jgi:hypothetical protein
VCISSKRLAQGRHRIPLILEILTYAFEEGNKEKRLAMTSRYRRGWFTFLAVFLTFCACNVLGTPESATNQGGLMYIGTLDHKLLVIDEDKEEVVGEIPLTGIARTTALSADQKQLYIINTQMTIEIVDLASRKVVGTINLADERSHARVSTSSRDWLAGGAVDHWSRFSGLAVDPTGHYLYTTLRIVTKDIDQYRLEAPKFVAIDLDKKAIAKAFDFPKGFDQGFGFMATYKVSPDGKLLYVFDTDVVVLDLSTLNVVDRIPLAKPPYPGASPYRLTVTQDPYVDKTTVTSIFISVDPIVHKGTLGFASLNLLTREVKYSPIGPALPMMGFMLSPDRKRGYSVMYTGAGANRRTEWWVWNLETHRVIQKEPFESRTTFNFGLSSDGKKLYLYGSGSSLEIFDVGTLKSHKLMFLNKDLTTDLITLAR